MPATRIVAPSVEQQKKYYVYTLAYPDDIVFYVGKGQDDRIDRHEHDACRSDEAIKSRYLNLEKCQVIRTIWEQGKQVKKNIVFETDIELDAYIYEWVLINMVYADQLVNIHSGGQTRSTPTYKLAQMPQQQEVSSDTERYLSIKEACDYLGLSRRTLYKYIDQGHITKYRRGIKRDVFFKQSELKPLLEYKQIVL